MEPLPQPTSLAQQAYASIRRAIQDRSLVPGVMYSENEISKQLGISRTPVREAVIELANESIVDIKPRRGFTLHELTAREVDEAFEIRCLLEAMVLRRLAAEASDADIAQLREVLAEQEAAVDDVGAFLAADERFHLLMPKLVGLERTASILSSIRGLMWLIGSEALLAPLRVREVLVEHRAVVDALDARDADAAMRAIAAHLHLTVTSLEQNSPS